MNQSRYFSNQTRLYKSTRLYNVFSLYNKNWTQKN